MNEIKENEIIFDFTLSSCEGGEVSSRNLPAKYNVIYFYPKDDTPGCTMEAKEFASLKSDFDAASAAVFGVSKDDKNSHIKFKNKYDLNFDLLTDESDVTEKFGIWVEKNMYGKKYMGIERSTFLLDKSGKILKIWKKVKPEGHAMEVLEYIKNI